MVSLAVAIPSRDSRFRSLKRPLLYFLIGSTLLGAAFGVFAVLRGTWTWFEIRVLMSTIVFAAGSLCALACDLSRTNRGLNLLPKAGLTLTIAGATAMLVGMWGTIEYESYWKMAFSIAILAIATVHVCMLSFARLERRFRWVFAVSVQLVYGLAMVLVYCVFFESWNESLGRIIAVLSILATAASLVIPLLHRISRITPASVVAEAPLSPFEQSSLVEVELELSRLQKRVAELEMLKQQLSDPSRQV